MLNLAARISCGLLALSTCACGMGGRTVSVGLLAPELKGEQGADVRARLKDDAPAPGAIPLEVNELYPEGLPHPTTPAVLLQALPPLPTGLRYQIIGKDMILLDTRAALIVDFMRNAVRWTPAA